MRFDHVTRHLLELVDQNADRSEPLLGHPEAFQHALERLAIGDPDADPLRREPDAGQQGCYRGEELRLCCRFGHPEDIHIPLVVFPSPSSRDALVAPALRKAEPAKRHGQCAAAGQNHPCHRGGHLGAQRDRSAPFVLEVVELFDDLLTGLARVERGVLDDRSIDLLEAESVRDLPEVPEEPVPLAHRQRVEVAGASRRGQIHRVRRIWDRRDAIIPAWAGHRIVHPGSNRRWTCRPAGNNLESFQAVHQGVRVDSREVENLGQTLIARGDVTSEAWAAFLAVAGDRPAAGAVEEIGEELVEKGLLSSDRWIEITQELAPASRPTRLDAKVPGPSSSRDVQPDPAAGQMIGAVRIEREIGRGGKSVIAAGSRRARSSPRRAPRGGPGPGPRRNRRRAGRPTAG